MTYGQTLISEPHVEADHERGRVAFDLRSTELRRTIRILSMEPVTSTDCDLLLEWAERMEAAVDNLTSAVRIIQGRMERPADQGAGGRAVYDAG